jgi:hypothetical protein
MHFRCWRLLVDTNELKPGEGTSTSASNGAEPHLYLVEVSESADETLSADATYVDPWSRKTPAA